MNIEGGKGGASSRNTRERYIRSEVDRISALIIIRGYSYAQKRDGKMYENVPQKFARALNFSWNSIEDLLLQEKVKKKREDFKDFLHKEKREDLAIRGVIQRDIAKKV